MNIEHIARLAQVSTATVSRTINGSPSVRQKTADRVRKVIAEFGYVPNQSARALTSGRSRLFGVIISDITNPYFPELVRTFEDQCAAQHYDVILANTNYDPQRLQHNLYRMIERRVDGIAIFTSEMDEASGVLLHRNNIPVVTLAQHPGLNSFHAVQIDYLIGIRQSFRHLTSLGHSKIAFVAGPQRLWTARIRLDAFRAAAGEAGLRIPPEWIKEENFRIDGGSKGLQQLLAQARRPTAVLCSNDLMAIGALNAIRNAHLRVPEDISVIGMDDIDLASLSNPPLTTVFLPRKELAKRAFEILLAASEDLRMRLHNEVLRTKLIVRESTAAPRRSAAARARR